MIAPNESQHAVLVDTCIWVPFFERKQSIEKSAVLELIDDNRVVLIGPVLAELLQGFRRDVEADWVASSLRGVHFNHLEFSHWKSAARIGRGLVSRGNRIPLTDLVLAAIALDENYAVYSTDPHFDLIPNLTRFFPE